MEEDKDLISKRNNELIKYHNHPLISFLRNVKKTHIKAFERIMFYFGEFSEYEKQHRVISWASSDDDETHQIMKNAFQLLSPDMIFYEGEDDYIFEFRVEWVSIDDIVFNKHIFPDFCVVDKSTLTF